MTDATGSSSYVYDPFGELTSSTNGAGQVTGYGYNSDGQTDSITYPLPSTATWATTDTYDNADQLTWHRQQDHHRRHRRRLPGLHHARLGRRHHRHGLQRGRLDVVDLAKGLQRHAAVVQLL